MKETVSQHQFVESKIIGLFTLFKNFTLMSYKSYLVRYLIHRAFKIGSSYIILHKKLEKIKRLLQKNMCPKSVLDNQIETFLDKTVYSRQRYNFWKTKNITLKLTIYQIFFFHVTKREIRHICDCFVKIMILILHFRYSSFYNSFLLILGCRLKKQWILIEKKKKSTIKLSR